MEINTSVSEDPDAYVFMAGDGNSRFFSNGDRNLSKYTASYPRNIV